MMVRYILAVLCCVEASLPHKLRSFKFPIITLLMQKKDAKA
jgi:hypothetical protein